MKFINTKLASPVVYGYDRPHEYDLFNYPPDAVPITKKQYREFIMDNKIIIDERWWEIQYNRCIHGYTVKNAVVDGGEIFPEDERIVITDPKHPVLRREGIELKPGEKYIPHLKWIQKGNDLWIPPKMYFYLNFWTIKRDDPDMDRKIEGNPYFTDLSWENWMIRRRMFIEKKDHLWAKSRQKGLSEEEAANLAWFFLFLNNVQMAIVSCEDFYVQNTFNFVKRGIRKMINTQFYKEISVNNDSLLKTMNTSCEIHARTVKNNTQALSGLSPFFTLLEEIGIWKQGFVKEVMDFIKPSLFIKGQKMGYMTMIGTGSGDEGGVDDMEEMFYNPEQFNLLTFDDVYEDSGKYIAGFVPKYKFELVDKDNNSLKKASIEKIEKYRSTLSAEKLFLETVTSPIKPSEIFGVKGGAYFGLDVKEWCLEQKAAILGNRTSLRPKRYRIDWIDRRNPFAGCTATPDPEGEFLIVELPVLDSDGRPPDGLYWAGTDSYDQDESTESDSKGAIAIKKGTYLKGGLSEMGVYNNYVAMLVQRPSEYEGGKEKFYENTAKLCILYNAMNLVEHSKILIMEWYQKNGLGSILMEKPGITIANLVKNSEASNKYGFPASLIPEALSLQREYLSIRENVNNCFFPDMLTAWARFKYSKNYNCDLTIATTLATVALHEYKRIEEINVRKDSVIPAKKFGYRMVNGKLMRVFNYA